MTHRDPQTRESTTPIADDYAAAGVTGGDGCGEWVCNVPTLCRCTFLLGDPPIDLPVSACAWGCGGGWAWRLALIPELAVGVDAG